jgi:hypothetical protein
MTRLIYDGTFEGLLTAIFEIYDRRLTHVKMVKGEFYTSALFEDLIKITTDETRAGRVLKGLKQKVSAIGVQRLYIAHMAELENDDDTISVMLLTATIILKRITAINMYYVYPKSLI